MWSNTIKRAIFVIAGIMMVGVPAFAGSATFVVPDLEIIPSEDTAIVNEQNFDGENSSATIAFHAVGDEVKYNFTLKNNSSNDYYIEGLSLEGELENEYVSFELLDFEATELDSGNALNFYILAKYVQELPEEELSNDTWQEILAKVNVKYSIIESENPNTFVSVIPYVIAFVACCVILALAIKTKKKSYVAGLVLVAAMVGLPILTASAEDGFEVLVGINANIDLADKIVLTSNNQGETETKVVAYGSKLELTAPSKQGYDFVAWNTAEDGSGNNYIAGDTIKAEHTLNLFAIFTPRNDTPYVVTHSYQNLNDGYDNVVREKQGTTDSTITPELEPKTGFKNPNTTELKIKADGSASCTYVYDRETRSISYANPEFINTDTVAGEYLYGKIINVSVKDREGYTFSKWSDGDTNTSRTIELKENLELGVEYAPNTNTAYSVIHEYQNLSGGFDTEIEELSGTTDATVLAPLRPRNGFYEPEKKSLKITPDGKASVTYTYMRQTRSLSFTTPDFIESDVAASESILYGTVINLTAKNREGYTFNKWTDGNTNASRQIELKTDTELGVEYTANSNTPYTVTHSYQNLNGGYDDVVRTKYGTTDTKVTPELEPKTGFKNPSTTEINIDGDGNADCTYVYDRETRTIEFTTPDYIQSSEQAGEYLYGKQITISAKEKQGYHFVDWTDGNTNASRQIELTENISLGVNYAPNTDTPYTVTHHYQKLTDGYDEVVVDHTGTTDTTVDAALRAQEGFYTPDQEQIHIDANGQANHDYYYMRRDYSLIFTTPDYINSNVEASNKIPYGTAIELSVKTRAGYVFENWSDGDTDETKSFELTADTELGVVYSPKTDTLYQVAHQYQNLNGGYDEVVVDHTGTTDTTVDAEREPKTGFKTPELKQITITAEEVARVTYVYDRETRSISYDSLDYINTDTPAGEYLYGTKINVSPKEKTGYSFKQWSDGNTEANRQIELTENIVNLGVEYQVNQYMIAFNANNALATGQTLSQTVDYDQNVALNDNGFAVEYINFTGWNTEPDGSGESFTNKQRVEKLRTEGTITLYAQWDESEFPVVFRIEGDCKFNGYNGTVSSDSTCKDAISGTNYVEASPSINTGLKLLSAQNDAYMDDFMITFEFAETWHPAEETNETSKDNYQHTILNMKLEDDPGPKRYPGFAVRRSGEKIAFASKMNNVKISPDPSFVPATTQKITVIRRDQIVYYKVNNGEEKKLQSYENMSQADMHDMPLMFGSSIHQDGSLFRVSHAHIKNIVVRVGKMSE